MKSKIFPTYGIAASAAALQLRDRPQSLVSIDPVSMGFIVTLTEPPKKRQWIKIRRRPCTQVQKPEPVYVEEDRIS